VSLKPNPVGGFSPNSPTTVSISSTER